MPSLDELEFYHSLAHSARAEDRAVWIRIAADYFARADADDEAWVGHLRACLAEALPNERAAYLAKLMESRSRLPSLWDALAEFADEASPSAWKYAPDLPPRPLGRSLGAATARALATRGDLDDAWVEAILAAEDEEAIVALAANPLAPLRPEPLRALAIRARGLVEFAGDRRLADALLSRQPVRVELAPLFLAASPAGRQALLLAAQRFELARRRSGATATLSRDAIARLEQFALSGDNAEFTRLLARSIGASDALAARIVADPQGEPLAVALAAIGAPNDVCVRILTATDMQAGGAYPRLHALARSSDLLSPHAARRIIAALVAPVAPRPESPRLPPAHPRHGPGPAARPEPAKAQLPRKVNTFGAK